MYDLFNYFTYEIQILIQVLDLKELEGTYDIAKYAFSIVEFLILHIKKKAEGSNVSTSIDSKTGKVITTGDE